MPTIDCRYCNRRHGAAYLCGPAKGLLDAVQAKARSYDLPNIEFDAPLYEPDDGKVLLVQLVVKAAMIPVHGVTHPVLLLTGRTADGKVAPTLVFAASDVDMRAGLKLIADQGELALRRAREGI